MAGLNRSLFFILAFGLLFAFVFALSFSACSGDDDDDSRGDSDDDGVDDDTTDDDDTTGDCEKECLDSWEADYVACLNTLISCLDSGGNPKNCLNNAASCIGAAESDMCICGTNCNSDCMANLCSCREACTPGDQSCYDACFNAFSDCTGWFDSACYNSCYSTLQSCLASCIQSQNFSECYTCVTTYSSCTDNCY